MLCGENLMKKFYSYLFKDIKSSRCTSIIIWILEIILIIAITIYNKYLYTKYDNQSSILKYLGILSDHSYINFFIFGLLGIGLLIFLICCQVYFGFNHARYLTEQIIFAVISFFILIFLLVVYANPILVAFAVGIGFIGVISLSQY